MTRKEYLFTSESVSEGHPDKVSDAISDAIVDLFIGREPEARVAVETLTTTNNVVLAGEVRGSVKRDEMIEAARQTIKEIGYEQKGFHWDHCEVQCMVHGHAEGLSSDDIRMIVEPYALKALPEGWVDADTIWHVNPTGQFVIGGPDGDAGLTGRKIIVDTYGGAAPHGGGAFSGKDPTKVDRSAAYASRYVAKNVVAAGLASRCSVQLAYAIGVAQPLSIYVDDYGTGQVPPSVIEDAIRKSIDLTPRGIRQTLGLNRPIYRRTAAYGHFGRMPEDDGGFSWEKTDLADTLKKHV